jgi:hypothetical protein
MIALSSLALIIPGRLNRIMNAVVPASLVRGMMAKMFKKTLAKPQPQVKPQTGVTSPRSVAQIAWNNIDKKSS